MVTPDFKLQINKQDISEEVKSEIMTIEFNDRFENEADNLIIEFADLYSFEEDDTVDCWIGYKESGLYYVGSFVINEVLNKKFTTSISATSFDFSLSMKEKKNRSFKNVTTKQIVEKIAKEHEFSVKIDSSLFVKYIAQTNESDLNFLQRVAKVYDLVFSIKNKTIIMIKEEETLPAFYIDERECSDYDFRRSKREKYNSVEISWHDTKSHSTKKVMIGEDEPTLKISKRFSNEAEARAVALSELKKTNGKTISGTISTYGQNIIAGGLLDIDGFGEMDYDIFIAKEVSHRIDENGYNMTIQFELKPDEELFITDTDETKDIKKSRKKAKKKKRKEKVRKRSKAVGRCKKQNKSENKKKVKKATQKESKEKANKKTISKSTNCKN